MGVAASLTLATIVKGLECTHRISLSLWQVSRSQPRISLRTQTLTGMKLPIATLLIGSAGRNDAVGSAGRAQLLLVKQSGRSPSDLLKVTVSKSAKAVIPSPARAETEPISWAWKIVRRDIQTSFVELDKESFFSLLMEIAGA